MFFKNYSPSNYSLESTPNPKCLQRLWLESRPLSAPNRSLTSLFASLTPFFFPNASHFFVPNSTKKKIVWKIIATKNFQNLKFCNNIGFKLAALPRRTLSYLIFWSTLFKLFCSPSHRKRPFHQIQLNLQVWCSAIAPLPCQTPGKCSSITLSC